MDDRRNEQRRRCNPAGSCCPVRAAPRMCTEMWLMVALRCPLHQGLCWVDHMPPMGLEHFGAGERAAASGVDGRGADGCGTAGD